MKWIAIFLMFSVATAATLDNNGNLLLSKQEVDNTRELFNKLNRVIRYQDHRIEELEKVVQDVEKRKCL